MDVTVFERVAGLAAEVAPSFKLLARDALRAVAVPADGNVATQAARLARVGEDDDFIFSFQGGKFPILPKNKEITQWLSLHINSPAFILAAA